ncbi:MAG: histidine phosphatase family protein [Christensenellales bacterium]|jgi:alpha-ribazole phosphatase
MYYNAEEKNPEYFTETERVVYLVRHAKPHFAGGVRLCIGRLDPPLSVAGIQQGMLLARRFDGVALSGVFASPQRRAIETALLLSEGRWPVTAVHGLQELDIGEWEGRTFEDVKANDAETWNLRQKRPDLYWPKGSEPPAAGLERFKRALFSLLNRTQGDIAVVAHSGVNRVMLAYLRGMHPSRMFENPQQYTGVSVLRFMGAGVRVEFEDAGDRHRLFEDRYDREQ